MDDTQPDDSAGLLFDSMRESVADGHASTAAITASLTGILASPFATPYPTQRPGARPVAGLAGELRGSYRRSDGVDRWKPNWSGFDHPRSGDRHKGVDIYAPVGTDIVAIADGYAVLYPNPRPLDELGIKVGMTITGSDGIKYDVIYGHLSSLNGVSRSVKKGEILGKTGCTGNAEDGACSTPNTCGRHSSHLHIEVRESKPDSQYVDPLALFNWTFAYANDSRDVACNQAFSAVMLEREAGGDANAAPSRDLLHASVYASPGKRYTKAFFSAQIASDGEVSLLILERLSITLKVVDQGPYPGLFVSIKGRQRMFFHPSLAQQSTSSITASFENVDLDGNATGDMVRLPLITIKGEPISDTGLRTLSVDTYIQGSRLDLDKPIKFLGEILEAD